jgi:hypothetical protein
VVGVPLVAAANSGYKLLDVEVSLDIDAPATIVWNVGNAPAPLDTKTCPDVPKEAKDWNAPVDVVPPASNA